MAAPTPPSNRSLNPDRLTDLEEERDFLLRSLADLEAEHVAGDIDQIDFQQLQADYTVRASDAIRRVDDHEAAIAAAAPKRSFTGMLPWILGLAVFAVAAGWLLGQAMGERGVMDQITGSVDPSPRDQFLDCQVLDQQQSIGEANECYTTLLQRDPANAEALAYKGWLLVRTSGSASQLGRDSEAAELLVTAKGLLDRAVEVDDSYPDARAFRIIVLNAEGDTDAACAEFDQMLALDPPPFMVELVTSAVFCP